MFDIDLLCKIVDEPVYQTWVKWSSQMKFTGYTFKKNGDTFFLMKTNSGLRWYRYTNGGISSATGMYSPKPQFLGYTYINEVTLKKKMDHSLLFEVIGFTPTDWHSSWLRQHQFTGLHCAVHNDHYVLIVTQVIVFGWYKVIPGTLHIIDFEQAKELGLYQPPYTKESYGYTYTRI